MVTFTRQSSMSLKDKSYSIWSICWMLPLATCCHTHYHLHPSYFVLLKFKDLVAKQHITNRNKASIVIIFAYSPYYSEVDNDYSTPACNRNSNPKVAFHYIMMS